MEYFFPGPSRGTGFPGAWRPTTQPKKLEELKEKWLRLGWTEKLPEKASTTITVGDYEIQIEGECLDDGYKYDSGTDYLDVGCFLRGITTKALLQVIPRNY